MAGQALQERLRTDLTAAMRSRDTVATSTIRMALTSIKAAEVAGEAARTLSDDEVLAVLRTEVKKRREAAEAFDGAGRTEQAARERAEEGVLTAYLPAQMSDDDLTALVASAIESAAADGKSGPSAMGTVMGILRPQVGATVEGGRLAGEVRRQLAG